MIGKSLLRKPGERLVCYCPPGICQAPKGFSGPCNRACDQPSSDSPASGVERSNLPDLHSAIMNLPCQPATADELQGYRRGHRDARHAAAELALSAQARITELEEALRGLMELERRGRFMPFGREWDAARAALKETSHE